MKSGVFRHRRNYHNPKSEEVTKTNQGYNVETLSLLLVLLGISIFRFNPLHAVVSANKLSPNCYLFLNESRTSSQPLHRPDTVYTSDSLDPDYDEQLGISFTQNFISLAYKVTAVEQTGSDGYGPGYLLNGLSDKGYWYQVGLGWDWSLGTGFMMLYAVFDPSGNVIFPNNNQYLTHFSGPVNQGDTVLLNLYFSDSNQVVMLANDQNTGAQAYKTYSAEGATDFIGTPHATANSQGFFTGLMTEWYHTKNPYYGNEQKVVYTVYGSGISSAWMWIDEYNAQNKSQVLFSDCTDSLISYTNPTQLQEFSSHGATEYSNANEFITGSISTVALTLSYSVKNGGSGYSEPILTYTLDGLKQTATLSDSPTTYFIDTGMFWSTTGLLSGSSSLERWQTNQQTNVTAYSSETINLVYYHQYYITFATSVMNGGLGFSPPIFEYTSFGNKYQSLIASASINEWIDADTIVSYPHSLSGSSSSERWVADISSSIASSSGAISVIYHHQFYIDVLPNPSAGGSISAESGWFDAGASLQLSASANSLWQFEGWSGTGLGSYSGSGSPASIIINAPLTEEATFYPSIAITIVPGGSISYSYATQSGVLQYSTTLYVPVGSKILLTAEPSNQFYQFNGWNGQLIYTDGSISVSVNSPLELTANFGYSSLMIGGITVAAIVFISVLIVARRRTVPPPPPIPQPQLVEETAFSAKGETVYEEIGKIRCPYCKSLVSQDAAYCTECGSALANCDYQNS